MALIHNWDDDTSSGQFQCREVCDSAGLPPAVDQSATFVKQGIQSKSVSNFFLTSFSLWENEINNED